MKSINKIQLIKKRPKLNTQQHFFLSFFYLPCLKSVAFKFTLLALVFYVIGLKVLVGVLDCWVLVSFYCCFFDPPQIKNASSLKNYFMFYPLLADTGM
jgi:hypothetical protein